MVSRAGRPARLLALLVALLVCCAAPAAEAAAKRAFTIRDSRIKESSGLARDVVAQRYWTVNDSGDDGVVYALSTSGRVQGTLTFGAQPQDVEALALEGNRLYVGDIGDNRERRSMITVYHFDDPSPSTGVRGYRAWDFTYEDGPHDAEALLVSPTGRIYVVTKGTQGGIYRAPGTLTPTGTNELTRVGDAPAYVTDGTFLPGGDRIALRTYVSVFVLDVGSWKTLAQAATPTQPQGESVTMDLAGDALLVGSEGRRSTVYEMAVPTTRQDVPTASATPPARTPSATPRSTPAEDDPGVDGSDEPPAAGIGRQGTWMALGLAGALALAAGVTVALIRRR